MMEEKRRTKERIGHGVKKSRSGRKRSIPSNPQERRGSIYEKPKSHYGMKREFILIRKVS